MHLGRDHVRIFLATLLLTAALAQGQATTTAVNEVAAGAEAIKEIGQSVNGTSPRTAAHVADVVQIRMEEGQLVIRTDQAPTAAREWIRIADRPGLCIFEASGKQDSPVWVPKMLNFSFWNMSRPGREATHVSALLAQISISRDVEENESVMSITLIQSMQAHNDKPGMSLRVSGSESPGHEPVRIAVSAASLEKLLLQYPQETTRYLLPIMEDFRQVANLFAVDSRLAWQVFSDALKPDAETVQRIEKAIARLDAEAYANRDAASTELEKLGQAAASYLGRLDRSKLSAEQRSRIDQFLSSWRPIDSEQARAFRHDVNFLLNCLYNDDPAVREQAIMQLRAVTGKPIPFERDWSAQQRAERVSILRSALAPATHPADRTEQPAIDPKGVK